MVCALITDYRIHFSVHLFIVCGLSDCSFEMTKIHIGCNQKNDLNVKPGQSMILNVEAGQSMILNVKSAQSVILMQNQVKVSTASLEFLLNGCTQFISRSSLTNWAAVDSLSPPKIFQISCNFKFDATKILFLLVLLELQDGFSHREI